MHPTPSSEGKSEETAGNLSKEGRETTRQEDMKRNGKLSLFLILLNFKYRSYLSGAIEFVKNERVQSHC